VLAAPEELAVDDKGRHPEDALRLGGAADPLDLRPPLLRRISLKTVVIGPGLGSSSRFQKRSKTMS
jgi:hypothetical protein